VVEGMDVVMRVQEVRTNGEDEPCHPVLVAGVRAPCFAKTAVCVAETN